MLLVLRIVHIVAGTLWVGGVVATAVFIIPSVMASGPAGGPVMHQMVQARRMPNVLLTFAILTVLAGAGLLWIDASAGAGTFVHSPFGATISVGAALAVAGVLVGMFVSVPLTKRIGAVAAAVQSRGGPPTEAEATEIARLQRRALGAARAVAVLVVLAVTAMAVARYV